MNDEKLFPIEGKLYILRKSESGHFDIFDKETGIHVNELFGKNCMKTLARKYLGLFGIEVGTQDGIKTGKRLEQLMEFLKENEFVTYQRNVHIMIHKNNCSEIAKNGGTGTNVEYHYFQTFSEAKLYAESEKQKKGLEIKFCTHCF